MKSKTVRTNIWGLKAGDVITFTNSVNYKVRIEVKRVEEKSWYQVETVGVPYRVTLNIKILKLINRIWNEKE